MNYEEKKSFFSRYRLIDSNINALLNEKHAWRQKALLIDKVCSGAKCIEKVIDLESEIDQEIDKLIDLRKSIYSIINTLDDEILKRIVVMKYIEFKSFEKIGEEIAYCEKQVARLHRKALDLIEI